MLRSQRWRKGEERRVLEPPHTEVAPQRQPIILYTTSNTREVPYDSNKHRLSQSGRKARRTWNGGQVQIAGEKWGGGGGENLEYTHSQRCPEMQ